MCEPTTILTIATVASAAVGAYSSIQQGRAAYQAGMYNAQIAERNAQAAEDEQARIKDEAAIERRRLGERVRAERGELNAKFTAMGLDPGFGTPADLIGDVEQAYDIDRSILGRNEISALERLDKERADYLDSANMQRAGAKSAWQSGKIGAVGSLLDGAASVSGRWIQPGRQTTQIAAPAQAAQPLSIFQAKPLVQVGQAPVLRVGGG